jgi:hypothetical protein
MATQTTNAANVERLGHGVAANAQAVGVSQKTAWLAFWLPLLGAVAVAATYGHRRAYYWLLAEDHPVEWLQFALVVAGSLLAAMTALRLHREGDRLGSTLFVVFALGMFVIAGEEISWGQRVFAFGTPTDLASVNNEHEFNVHNITKGMPLQSAFKLVELLLGLVGTVVPLYLARARRVLRASALRLLTPPLFLVPSFALVFTYRLGRFLTDSHRYSAAVRFQEWPELTFYFGLAVVAYHAYATVAGRAYQGSHRPLTARRHPTVGAISVLCFAALLTTALAIATIANGIAPGNPVDS